MCPAMSLSFPPLPFPPHLKSNTKLSLFQNSDSRFLSLTCHSSESGAPMGEEKNAFYVVKKGSVIGIYKSFTQIQPLLSSSGSGEPFSVYKGFSLPEEAEKYLVSHALEGATYSISAANIKAGSLGKLVLCTYQGEDEPSSVSTYLQPAFLSPNRCYSCTIEFDGASTQNSERAGAGAILYANDDSKVHRFREGVGCNPMYVAEYTKYIAEYRALILGLKHALKKGYEDISIVRGAKEFYDFPNMSDNNKMELCMEVKKLKKKFQSFKTIICPEDEISGRVVKKFGASNLASQDLPILACLEYVKDEEGRLSCGYILCCELITDSNVTRGNSRFWNNFESNVGDKVWKAISNLGIMQKDRSKDYKKKISELEACDLVRRWSHKASSKAPK